MGGDEAVIVAGIGCRRGISAAAVVAVLRAAEARAGVAAGALATAGFKVGEAGIAEAAGVLGLRLHWVDDAELALVQGGCVTLSETVRGHTGHGAIAEAAALAACGAGARLVLARIAVDGATCALAEGLG